MIMVSTQTKIKLENKCFNKVCSICMTSIAIRSWPSNNIFKYEVLSL